MAQALGARLLDAEERQIGRGGAALADLDKIQTEGMDERLERLEVRVASDVSNPLCGPLGASAVYGPQKGATPEMVETLDKALDHYAEVIARDLKIKVKDAPGAGGAGGLGAGLMAFLKAKMQRGVALVLEAVNLEEYLEAADLVITGEGRIDSQMEFGKTLSGVGALAKRHGIPVVALAGAVDVAPEKLAEIGILAAIPCANGPASEADCMEHAAELLQEAAERIMRLLILGRGLAQRGR
jgi:glycerate kinase